MKKFKVLLGMMLLGSITILSSGCGNASEETKKGAEISIEVPQNAQTAVGELPIGSVVKLADSEQKYVVVATLQKLPNNPDKTWDFLAYAYPQGNQQPEIGFDSEQIAEVCFEGAQSVDEGDLMTFEAGEDYLPLGTIVAVDGAPNPLMICGRLQTLAQTGALYEYSACDYPEGLVNAEDTYLFNSDLITGVYFKGYASEEEVSYQYFLDAVREQKGE